uniref:Thioredoxin-fold protein n=1 Tax=Pithovirus LCPAC406 TaxID=2506599 RepID=A0A481ZEZ4_9VIRU|nr:MAG: thioredoxin-fold protein [Pithovirus LCPAC406]
MSSLKSVRADLVIITAEDCGACGIIDSEKYTIIREYSKRDDIKIIFIHETKADIRERLKSIYPNVSNLASWTPFVILVSSNLINGNLKYEIMNNGTNEYSHNKSGIDKFVEYQMKNNPIFAVRSISNHKVTSVTATYLFEGQSRNKQRNSKYSLDRKN